MGGWNNSTVSIPLPEASLLGSRLMFRTAEMGASSLKLFVPSTICQRMIDSDNEKEQSRSSLVSAARFQAPMLKVSMVRRSELLMSALGTFVGIVN